MTTSAKIETLHPVCYAHTVFGGRRKTDASEVMGNNWGEPFCVIRELLDAPSVLTQRQALLLASGVVNKRQWIRDGLTFEPYVLPIDVEEASITLVDDAAECTLTVTIQIDVDAWDFVFQCRKS